MTVRGGDELLCHDALQGGRQLYTHLLLLVGLIGGLIFALITTFKKTWSPVTAPIYALLEGLVLGSISAVFEQRYPGIAIESVSLLCAFRQK